eukprot:783831-Alexandrium_andersonii.AAC.1
MKGVFPSTGYLGAEFPANSWRRRLGGDLATGHRLAFVGCKSDLKARRDTHSYVRNFSAAD